MHLFMQWMEVMRLLERILNQKVEQITHHPKPIKVVDYHLVFTKNEKFSVGQYLNKKSKCSSKTRVNPKKSVKPKNAGKSDSRRFLMLTCNPIFLR